VEDPEDYAHVKEVLCPQIYDHEQKAKRALQAFVSTTAKTLKTVEDRVFHAWPAHIFYRMDVGVMRDPETDNYTMFVNEVTRSSDTTFFAASAGNAADRCVFQLGLALKKESELLFPK